MAPVGSDLTISQLLEALRWKIATGNDKVRGPGRSSIVVAEVDELRTKLSDVSRLLTIHRNSFCPVNSLPPEILANIFQECILTGTARSFRPHEDDYPMPESLLKASQVCHYWRQTALCFSCLWSSIHVTPSPRTLANLFIDRSKQARLLKVYIIHRIRQFEKPKNADTVAKLYATLASQSHRFVECHMVVCAYDVSFLRMFLHPARNLEALSLRIEYPMADVPSFDLTDLFADHMPQLRKLALSCYTWRSGNCFKNLTHLSLHRLRILNFLDILAASPMLEELALIDASDHEGPTRSDVEGRTLDLAQLRRLEIGGWAIPHSLLPSVLLSRLIIPLETELCFWERHGTRSEDNMLDSIVNFGTRLSHQHYVTQLDLHCETGYADSPIPTIVHIKRTRMTIINFYDLNRLWQTPHLFPGQLEEVRVLRAQPRRSQKMGLDKMMAFFRSLLPFSSLSLSSVDLGVVFEAMKVLHNYDVDDIEPIIPEEFFDGYLAGATTWEEDTVADIQKYIPRVRLMSSLEIDRIVFSMWPTVGMGRAALILFILL